MLRLVLTLLIFFSLFLFFLILFILRFRAVIVDKYSLIRIQIFSGCFSDFFTSNRTINVNLRIDKIYISVQQIIFSQAMSNPFNSGICAYILIFINILKFLKISF